MMRYEKTPEDLKRELRELREQLSALKREKDKLEGLEESLKLTQYSIDHSSDIVFWVRPDSRFYYVNDAASRLLGYTKEELLSMCIPDIDMDVRYSRENWAKHWQDLKRRRSFTFETHYRRKDGTTFPVEISVNYLEFGGREYDFAFVKDITWRKRSEQDLQEAKARAELYVDLMGHDINNMNQIAMGYLELALGVMNMEGKLGEDNRVLIEKPVTALKNSARLIDSVRKLQRERSGELKPEIIDLAPLLSSIKDQFSSIPGRDVTINYLRGQGCRVIANELLPEVFVNLAGNAVKHSTGPLTVDIGLDTVIEGGKQYCKVTVADNGPGIPDEQKKTLLDRVCPVRMRSGGRGFGLCLVKLLLDDFNGRLHIEDRVPGDYRKGARFVVMLPAEK
jgi:PAS domain S-box-containing protein